MILKGKTAVVTGASDGIGKQIALKLAKEGVNLALVARDENRLMEVSTECLKAGSQKALYYSADLKDKNQIKGVFENIINDFKNINLLINNAGIWHMPRNLEEISLDEIENVINVNLTGLIQLTSLLIPTLKKQKESVIMNVSSRSGYLAQPGQSVYGASKWGVTGFTEVLKNDLKGSSVRVAGLYQGGTNTKLFKKANDPRDTSDFTEPSDLADVVVFMLSRPPKIWLHDVRVEK